MDIPYVTTFTTVASCKRKDNKIIFASIDELNKLIPKDTVENYTLYPFAANMCVVNKANKNGDLIRTPTAIEIANHFKNTHLDLEHDRKKIVGHFTNAGFSTFSENYEDGEGSKILSVDDVKNLVTPFNLSAAAVVYSHVFSKLVEVLTDSTDVDSENYLSIALSWEMSFSSYLLLLGDQDVDKGEIITDAKTIQELSKYLRTNGGTGETAQKEKVYRIVEAVTEDDFVRPLGGALTKSPAASVAGLTSLIDSSDKKNTEKTEKISVNTIITKQEKNMSEPKTEKIVIKAIASLDELAKVTDDNQHEYSFANVHQLVAEEIQKVSKQYSEEKKAKEEAMVNFTTKIKEFENKITELSDYIKKLEQDKAETEAVAIFNERMASFDEDFELNKELRQVIAKRINNLDESAYAEYRKEFEILAADKRKQQKAATTASSTMDVEKIVSEAAQAAEKHPLPPNSGTKEADDVNQTLSENFAKVFKQTYKG